MDGPNDNDEYDRKPSAVLVEPIPPTDIADARDRHGDDDDIEDDDDDDADNWSRQVETDESAPATASLLQLLNEDESSYRGMESVAEEEDRGVLMTANSVGEQDGVEGGSGSRGAAVVLLVPPPPPTHPELTLKEKLVMRERQRRIETERARLKRQFIAANDTDGDRATADGEEDEEEQSSSSALRWAARGGGGGRGAVVAESASFHNGTAGSVTEEGTLGEESMRAHPDNDDSREPPLGFNMERFLRSGGGGGGGSGNGYGQIIASERIRIQVPMFDGGEFGRTLEPMMEDRPSVMERFLNEPVVVAEPDQSAAEGIATSVTVDEDVGRSFEDEGMSGSGAVPGDVDDTPNVPEESFVSFGDDTNVSTNASVHVEADDDDVARDPLTPMASMDAPDAASDTVDADDEPRVLRLTEADMQEMAAIEEASIGNAPPSEREDEELSEIGELADFHVHGQARSRQGTPTTAVESASLHSAGNHSVRHASSTEEKPGSDGFLGEAEAPHPVSLQGMTMEMEGVGVANHLYMEPPLLADDLMVRMSPPVAQGSYEDQDQESPVLVNRVLRPGMINIRPHHRQMAARKEDEPDLGPVAVVDGFDFDKNAPSSPPMSGHRHDDSYGDLPPDVWSPAGKMHVSPMSFKPSALSSTMEEGPVLPFVVADVKHDPRTFRDLVQPYRDSTEGTPLLQGDIPPEVITSASPTDEFRESSRSFRSTRRFSMVSIGSIFSDVRSEEEVSKEEIQNESEFYLASSILARAFPERMFALTVTLIFEIPVLLMISGGSDALCQLVGRRRYQLLMGFIPLTSAISGNVGLQASTLTTRAISHTHVTPTNYVPWFLHEIGAAVVLGVGMGLLLGSIAFYASGLDFAFGFTILFAQFVSIVTAGCTGTFAPLLFSFIFRRDSGKWGGPLETAIQDIVGSFAMVIISYHILKFLGPGPISPDDVCSLAPTDDLS